LTRAAQQRLIVAPVTYRKLRFSLFPGSYAVCRLPPNAPVPEWALRRPLASVARTADELSIVCQQSDVPPGTTSEGPWSCIKLEGPFPFDQVGVLVSALGPLALAGIPIFALSTYDTDYVLVRASHLVEAVAALKNAGHEEI
jgi:hypothetical protein